MPYSYVISDPTQLHRKEVTYDASTTHSPSDKSAFLNEPPAPPPPNHEDGTNHVADDVIPMRANGVSAACSRSSSRSSGFDEISSSVTEYSLLPVTVAHAPSDIPEMKLSEAAGDDDKRVDVDMSSDSAKKNNDCDADSLDTLKITTDSNNNTNSEDKADSEPQQAAGDDQQDSCSSQVKEESTETDTRVEELNRQIEAMSERLNKLCARVKAEQQAESEMTGSTVSLNESTKMRNYSRNNAYKRWVLAKTGLGPDSHIVRLDRVRQPITAADGVAIATDNAPVDRITSDDVIAPASVTSTEYDVTSAIHESDNKEVGTYSVSRTRAPENQTNWSEMEAIKADRVTGVRPEICDDLETILAPNTYDLKPHALTEESLTLKSQSRSEAASVPLKSLDDLNTGDNISSQSYHLPRSHPRSASAQPEDAFAENVVTTPTRSFSRSLNFPSAPRRLLPDVPSHVHPRSSSVQPADEFDDGDEIFSMSLPRDASLASRRRLRPAASFDSVPRLMPTRRRFLLFTVFL